MESGLATTHRSSGRRRQWVRRHVLTPSLLVPLALIAVVYGLLLSRALDSLLIGIAAVALLGLIALITALGTEKSSVVLLVMAFYFAPLTNFSLGLKPLVLASAIFALSFALALPQMVHRVLRVPWMFLVGAVLFTVMGFIATPFAISAVENLIYVVTALIGLIVMPIAVAWMAPTERQIWACAFAFGLGAATSTLYGLPNFFYRNYGFTYHPVALAYTVMLALALVPFLLSSKMRNRWLVVPPMAVIALIGVWTSGSRTSLVVLAVLALAVPMFEKSIRLGLAVAACGSLLVGWVFVNYDPHSNSTSALSRLFGEGGASNSDTVRTYTLEVGIEQIKSNPILGNGYSTEFTYTIHNLYVQVLAAEGVIGLIGLLLMLTALLIPLRTASAPMRCLAYPVIAVVVAGPFQPNMGDHYLALTLGLAMVTAVRVQNRDGTGTRDPSAASDPVQSPAPGAIQARV